MSKFYHRVLPIWITLGLSTLAVLAVVGVVFNCIEASTLPPIHCGMRLASAIAALPVFFSHYAWQVSLVLIAAILVLRGAIRNWAITVLVPVAIFVLGVSLSVSILKIDCHRKVYGDEQGVCF